MIIKYLRRAHLAVAATAVAGTLALSGCVASNPGGPEGGNGSTSAAFLTIPREDMGTFSRNFNPFSPNAAPMTGQSIYESMLVYNPANGDTVPWLATDWSTGKDGKSLTFNLRDNVKFSDGTPLTSKDVKLSVELQKKLLGGFDYVKSIKTPDDSTVEFTFKKAFTPALYELGQQVIVPAHIWSKFKKPGNEENPKPVGTGPYTEVANFQAQSFELGKNPNYWQADKQKLGGIRMLAFAGNDGANLAAISGDVDWTQTYMPDIQTTYVDKDPEHRHFWFPTTGAEINWQLNTTKKDFSDVRVRKALSMAVDRDQVTKVGMSGYAKPADCTGLSNNYDKWRDTAVVEKCDWTKRDVEGAKKLLDEAGYKENAQGQRTTPAGKPFTFDISVGSSSTDWLSVANIIAQNLQDVGIKATVDSPDWASVTAGYETGEFDTGIVWTANAPTPYQYYLNLMGSQNVKPVGKQTFDNYHRFSDKKADELLNKFVSTSDEGEQKQIVNDLQARYSELAPVVPLFAGPEWGAYTTENFVGWPTEENPYATLSNRAPTTVLVLTSLEPAN